MSISRRIKANLEFLIERGERFRKKQALKPLYTMVGSAAIHHRLDRAFPTRLPDRLIEKTPCGARTRAFLSTLPQLAQRSITRATGHRSSPRAPRTKTEHADGR
jgi:hypothetical protein